MDKTTRKKEFLELVRKHQGILIKVSRLYTDTAADREDLLQEILFQLWRSFDSFRSDALFSTWMYRVALNTAITCLRSSSRDKLLEKDLPVEISGEVYAEGNDPREMLYEAIGKLSQAEKSIIILYLDDYKYEEIADILGISVSNTGVKINRIKKKLEKILTNMGYGL